MAKNFYDQYYGNNLWRLPKSEIGPPPPYHENKPWWANTWVRNLIQAGEVVFDIAISFIPGLDLSMPGVIATELVINEAGGALNEEIDISGGHTSITNSLFYFGGPIIGVIFGEFANVYRISRNINKIRKQFEFSLEGENITNEIEKFKKDLLRNNLLVKEEMKKVPWSMEKRSWGEFKNAKEEYFYRMVVNEEKLNYSLADKNSMKKIIDKIQRTTSVNSPYLGVDITDISSEDTEINEEAQPQLEKEAQRISQELDIQIDQARNIIKLLYAKEYKLTVAERNSMTSYIYKILKKAETLNPGGSLMRKYIVDSVDKEITIIESEEQFYTLFIGNYKEAMRKFKIVSGNILAKSDKNYDLNAWQRFMKYTGSKKFRKITGYVKYLNPSLAARKPANWVYKKLSKYLDKLFDREVEKKAIKKAEKKIALRELRRKIESGEIIYLHSSWLATIRVLLPSPTINICLITFDPGTTYGKEPVIIKATDEEILALIAQPGKTYIDLFAISRGGSSHGLVGLLGFKLPHGREGRIVNDLLSKVVNFLPINSLRNMLSIASVFKREGTKMAKGTYFNTWGKKFISTFETYGISRASRLLSRKVLARVVSKTGIFDKVAGKLFHENIGTKMGLKRARREVDRFLGMEFQRYTTATVSYGFKNMLKGRSFSKGMDKRLYTAATRTMRDHLLHYQRHNTRGSAFQGLAVQNVKIQRRGKIYRRLPTLFMNAKFKHKIHF